MLDFRIACEKYLEAHGDAVKRIVHETGDRFYQVDKSAEGVGLGLSIAKSIAEQNGWKIGAKTDNELNILILEIK